MSSADWLRDVLPDGLKGPAWFGSELWQWLVVPVLLALTFLAAFGLAWLANALLRRTYARTEKANQAMVAQLTSPLRLLFVAALCWLWLPGLQLPADVEQGGIGAARGALGLAFFWGLFRAITLVSGRLNDTPWVKTRPGSRSLVSLGARLARIALFAAGVVTLLSGLGYPVTSLLAGLGLGGLALALAAQKTVENLFGAFALAVDQPFREGDFVKVDELTGTVESIGMRSTQLRTPDRTVVSIPNGKLADSRIETFAARDRIRLACTVSVVRESTAAQVRAVLEGVEKALRAQPKLWPDGLVVKLSALAPSSLDIEVNAWFATQDFAEFQQLRQDVLLGFVEAVEKAGSALAYPTRTVHVSK